MIIPPNVEHFNEKKSSLKNRVPYPPQDMELSPYEICKREQGKEKRESDSKTIKSLPEKRSLHFTAKIGFKISTILGPTNFLFKDSPKISKHKIPGGENLPHIFCKLTKEEYAIPPLESAPVEIIAWDLGKGKTHYLAQRIEEAKKMHKRIVVIVPHQSLARRVSKIIDLPCYLDFQDRKYPEWKKSLVVCFPSLHKVRGKIDLLAIDESEGCLQELTSKLMSPLQAKQAIQFLQHDIKNTPEVILLDAHASRTTIGLLKISNRLHETRVLVCPQEERTWVDIKQKKVHEQLVIERVEEGKKLAIACMSKEHAEDLSSILKKRNPDLDIRCITKDTIKSLEAKYLGQDLFLANVLIYSPVLCNGVSIDTPYYYDEFHIFISQVGDSRTARQMTGRVRKPKDRRIFFSGRHDEIPELKEWTREKLEEGYKQNSEEFREFERTWNVEINSLDFINKDSQEYIEIITLLVSDSIQHGKNWIPTWIRNNETIVNISIEENKKIRDQIKEEKKQNKLQKAHEIVHAPEIKKLSAERIKQFGEKTLEEKYAFKKYQLCETFGLAFKEANIERQIEIAEADLKGNLTRQTMNFVSLRLLMEPEGKTVLAKRDRDDIRKNHPNNRENHAITTQFHIEILNILKVSLYTDWGTKEFLDLKNVELAMAYVKAKKAKARRLRIPIPSKKYQPMHWASIFLRKFGFCFLPIQKQKNNKRRRFYRVSKKSAKNTMLLSQHQYEMLKEKYLPPQKRRSLKEPKIVLQKTPEKRSATLQNIDYKEETSTEKVHTLSRVYTLLQGCALSKEGEKEKRREEKRDGAYAPTPVLLSPSLLDLKFGPDYTSTKAELEEALEPSMVIVDAPLWKSRRAKLDREDTPIEKYVDELVEKGEPLQFTAIGRSVRCSRRYALVGVQRDSLLLSVRETKDIEVRIHMSTLPSSLRGCFEAPAGQILFILDLNRAHLSFLAMLSKDDQMEEWLAGDPHQSTGDLLTPMLPKVERRKLGKEVNSAMVAGAGPGWLGGKLKDAGVWVSNEESVHLHNRWWDRFPLAKEYREEHKRMIARKVFLGEGIFKKGGGRTLFRFDKATLAGKVALSNWPDTEEKRRVKAERSAFSAILRGIESQIMDQVMVAAYRLGLRLVCPMHDGAVWSGPANTIKEVEGELKAISEKILESWGVSTGVSIKISHRWGE